MYVIILHQKIPKKTEKPQIQNNRTQMIFTI